MTRVPVRTWRAVPIDPPPADSPLDDTTLDETTLRSLKGRGVLAVRVPVDAKLFVNNSPTKSTGEVRRFVSKNLSNGFRYDYKLRAEFVQDGKTVTQTQVVSVRPGRLTNIEFGAPSVETSLTLNVPEDATVLLSGVATKAKGSVRKFSTKKIARGKKWTDYTVQVVAERDGRTVTKEKKISIHGGDKLELDFDFDGGLQLADAR